MRVVSVALAFQLVSAPVGTAGKEEESESERERARKRSRRKQNAEIQRISLERQRARCVLYVCVCVGSGASMRKVAVLFASFHSTRLCLHALVIIGRRGPKTNQM